MDLLSIFFTGYKIFGLLSFAYPLSEDGTILNGDEGDGIPSDPKIIVDEDEGMDLFEETYLTFTINNTMEVNNLHIVFYTAFNTRETPTAGSKFLVCVNILGQ